MQYPRLSPLPRRKSLISAFYGYEHLEKVRPGAFYDMKNLSADRFPLMSVRPARLMWTRSRGTPAGPEEIPVSPATPLTAAATVNGTAALCSETDVYYYGRIVPDAPLTAGVANRRIVPFGRNFFVSPDGVYVITDETGAVETRRAAYSQALLDAEVRYVYADGTAPPYLGFSDTPPETPEEGEYWTDTSAGTMLQKQYLNGGWQTVGEVYLRVTHAMAAHYAQPGDRVRVKVGREDEVKAVVFRAEGNELYLSAVLVGIDPTSYIVAVRKPMPVLDLALEHDNRVWGCRFGKNADGEFVNEIYASALGDPTKWDQYDGVSTDSYTVSLGCPGAFTGAAVVGGEVVFFKENYVIRVRGLTPQDYTVTVTPALGVKAGHAATLAPLNEKLFYLSTAGITVYDGALPYVISPEFSTHGFTDTLAFAWSGRYYLAAAVNAARRIYVYDTATGLWHVEDDDWNARFFLLIDSAVFMLCRPDPSNTVYRFVAMDAGKVGAARNILGPPDGALTFAFAPVPQTEWYAETGRLLADSGTSILRGLVFRVSLEKDAEFQAELECGDGRFIQLCRVRTGTPDVFLLPVNTPRCAAFRLRLSGKGGCAVLSVGLISEKTGEVKGLVR